MRLALKFTLVFLLGISTVLGLTAYSTCQREIAFYEADTARDQRILGAALAMSAAQLWQVGGEESVRVLVERANAAEHRHRLNVRWIPSAATPGAAAPSYLPKDQLERFKQGNEAQWVGPSLDGLGLFWTASPVHVDGQLVGAIETSESLADERPQIRAIVQPILVATIEVTAVCGLLALLLGVRLVGRPVSRLIAGTRAIAGGDLEQRIEFHQHDELAELASEINVMCAQLAQARDRLQAENAARISTIEQLRHADRLKTVGQLASGVAHELGTPLNVIAVRAKTLTQFPGLSESGQNAARVIGEQSARITRIIQQLLEFARPRRIQRVHTPLSEVVRKTFQLLDSLARRHAITLDARIHSEVSADIDAGQIEQVLTNLVVNAIQAMPAGGAIRVSFGRRRAKPPIDQGGDEREFVFIEVQDDGPGIEPEALPRVFEPFFTTKEVGTGTGLGLSISLGIVREHHGWIDVQNTPGSGARFTVYLPLTADAPADGRCSSGVVVDKSLPNVKESPCGAGIDSPSPL